jgi:hypothetical protein
MTHTLNKIIELQTKTMETVFENAKTVPSTLINAFSQPLTNPWLVTDNTKAIYENTKKFNTAYLTYTKALTDMLEATYETAELINNSTKSN